MSYQGIEQVMIVDSIQALEQRLAPEARTRLRVLMVSLDPVRDDVKKLRKVTLRHHTDPSRWLFARASEADLRKIAAVLGISYKRLPDGRYNHTTLIRLLDADGLPVAQTDKLGLPNPAFLGELQRAVTAE